jgi:hypothetical protein
VLIGYGVRFSEVLIRYGVHMCVHMSACSYVYEYLCLYCVSQKKKRLPNSNWLIAQQASKNIAPTINQIFTNLALRILNMLRRASVSITTHQFSSIPLLPHEIQR